jgi:hypothetical protein
MSAAIAMGCVVFWIESLHEFKSVIEFIDWDKVIQIAGPNDSASARARNEVGFCIFEIPRHFEASGVPRGQERPYQIFMLIQNLPRMTLVSPASRPPMRKSL